MRPGAPPAMTAAAPPAPTKPAPAAKTRRRSRVGDSREDREAVIIAAGLAEFLDKGYAATRVDDVAKRAGVAKGTVYLYFPSKEDLFHAVVRRSIAPLVDVVEAVAATPGASAAEVLKQVLATLYREVAGTDRREVLRLLIAESGRFPQLAAYAHTVVVRRGGKALRALVAEAVARGEFRPGPAADTPEVLMGPAVLALVWTLVFHDIDPLDLDAVLDAHVDLILRGLAPAPRS